MSGKTGDDGCFFGCAVILVIFGLASLVLGIIFVATRKPAEMGGDAMIVIGVVILGLGVLLGWYLLKD